MDGAQTESHTTRAASRKIRTAYTERIYVKVSTDFDSIGYLMPKAIIWSDGRIFPIEEVRDFRPASMVSNGRLGDCYTVIIRGEERHLFFERYQDQTSGRLGRWYVETMQN